MAPQSQSDIALMSIKPEYANAIFDGTKLVEFRKQPFKRSVRYIIVYSSSPEKKILGYFELGDIDVRNPRTLWKLYRDVGSIKYSDYSSYFGDRKIGVALHVKKVFRLDQPVSLNQLRRNLKPPQSYCYVGVKYFEKLRLL
jgi:predicted transcriptional regulator